MQEQRRITEVEDACAVGSRIPYSISWMGAATSQGMGTDGDVLRWGVASHVCFYERSLDPCLSAETACSGDVLWRCTLELIRVKTYNGGNRLRQQAFL